jgi:hypothetical protein
MSGDGQTGTAEVVDSRQNSPADNPTGEASCAGEDYFQRVFNRALINLGQSTQAHVIRSNPFLAKLLDSRGPVEPTAPAQQCLD